MMLLRLLRRIDSNSMMSLFWYAVTRFVMARISGSFLYGFASCESNGLIPDFISMLARTRYLRQVVRRDEPDSS
uniref:Putative secreted peptide n=1 Tax=Anopheles braziliensis TaxID=58242 RepID=A0A2M3ZRS1_9DIPT